MTAVEFADALGEYTDADGLVSPYRMQVGQRNGSGNGLLYTSLAYLLLAVRARQYGVQFAEMVRKCYLLPGLLRRGPAHPDHEGPDDYLAVGAAAGVLRLGAFGGACKQVAGEILRYGRAHWWMMNNVDPGRWRWSSWFGRFPALIAHLEWAAWEPPPLWRRLAWAGALWLASRAEARQQDSWVQSWMMVLTVEALDVESLTPTLRWWEYRAMDNWRHRARGVFPGGLRQCLGEYFGNGEHPLVRYAPENWEGLL